MDDLECSICFHPYGLTNRPTQLPCDHTLCFCCLEQIPKNVNEVHKKCPFCRRDFDMEQCRENLSLLEEALLESAKEQSKDYPFHQSPCSKCKRYARFSDLFCCFDCNPEMMENAASFNSENIKKAVMCPLCADHHQYDHNSQNVHGTVLPLTIFTTTNLSSLGLDDLFAGYKKNPYMAAFTFDLICLILDRQETTEIPDELMPWLTARTEEFVDYAEDFISNNAIHSAIILFGHSARNIISAISNRCSPLEFGSFYDQALVSLQRVAQILISVVSNPSDPSFTAEVAAQELVWNDFLSVNMNLWHHLLLHDNQPVSLTRTAAIKSIITFVDDVFPAADTKEFLVIIFNTEYLDIDNVASDPSTTSETQAALADYRSQLEQLDEDCDATALERMLLLAEELRNDQN